MEEPVEGGYFMRKDEEEPAIAVSRIGGRRMFSQTFVARLDLRTKKNIMGKSQMRLSTGVAAGLYLALAMGLCACSGGSSTSTEDTTVSFQPELADTGCSMAHCSSDLSSVSNAVAPLHFRVLDSVTEPTIQGSSYGLGCSSNLQLVACTLGADTPSGTGNLVAYGADGSFKFGDTKLLLDHKAHYSAPIVFRDGTVLAVDDQRIVLFSEQARDSVLGWITQPANLGVPVSPVPISSNIILMASTCTVPFPNGAPSLDSPPPCAVTTWDLRKIAGAHGKKLQPADLQYLYDPDSSKFSNGNNGFYETLNTPVVDKNGPNGVPRVYIEGSALCYPALNKAASCDLLTPRQAQMLVYDVDPDTGKLTAVTGDAYARYYYPGPGGASPTLVKNAQGHAEVFFDGLVRSPTLDTADCDVLDTADTPMTGCFYGIVDDGSGLTQLWKQSYPKAQFQAAATVDPRGGLWINPLVLGAVSNCGNPSSTSGTTPYLNCLIHVSATDGTVINTGGVDDVINPDLLFSDGAPDGHSYGVTGVPTISSTATGGIAMTLGVHALPTTTTQNYVMLIDISVPGSPQSLMGTDGPFQLPTGLGFNMAAGQFPIVSNAQGTHIVFTSRLSGPIFIGD